MPLSPIREITDLNVQPIACDFNLCRGDEHAIPSEALDLDFSGLDTQYATHAIHPYVASVNPPLARTLITQYVPQQAMVLDPFCGGGGILVEAILNGRKATGYDVNPLAALISRVKTTQLSTKLTIQEYVRILDEARTDNKVFTDDVPEVVRNWYKEDTLVMLQSLRHAIDRVVDRSVRELFQVALSATARDVMLTYRGEIRLRHLQGGDLERFKPNVLLSFRKRAEVSIARVSALPISSRAVVSVQDARHITNEYPVHSVISSPPYADDTNGVGYFQFSRNMLYWLGFSLTEQKEQRRSFLGSGDPKLPSSTVPPSETLKQTLDVLAERNRIHLKQALNFYCDYYQALANVATLVEERIIIIIGDRVLSRTRINNGHITADFLRSLGFGLRQYYTRQLRQKRIANMGGDGGGTSIEHILVFKR